MADHPQTVPDYAALATAEIERKSGKPRGTWGAYAPEHQAVTALLKQWALSRGVAVTDIATCDMQRMAAARARAKYEPKPCERCGREYVPKGPSSRYCHRGNCWAIAARKARQAA